MLREFKPGEKVTSITIRELGVGTIHTVGFDDAIVVWSDGSWSRERLQDLIWAGDGTFILGAESVHTFRAEPIFADLGQGVVLAPWGWESHEVPKVSLPPSLDPPPSLIQGRVDYELKNLKEQSGMTQYLLRSRIARRV